MPPCFFFKYWNNGWASLPFTFILLNNSKVVPHPSLLVKPVANSLILSSAQGSCTNIKKTKMQTKGNNLCIVWGIKWPGYFPLFSSSVQNNPSGKIKENIVWFCDLLCHLSYIITITFLTTHYVLFTWDNINYSKKNPDSESCLE